MNFFLLFCQKKSSNLAINQASDSSRRCRHHHRCRYHRRRLRTFISIFDIKQSNNINICAYLRPS